MFDEWLRFDDRGLIALTLTEILAVLRFNTPPGNVQRIDPFDYYVLRFSTRETLTVAGHGLFPGENGGVMFLGVEYLPL